MWHLWASLTLMHRLLKPFSLIWSILLQLSETHLTNFLLLFTCILWRNLYLDRCVVMSYIRSDQLGSIRQKLTWSNAGLGLVVGYVVVLGANIHCSMQHPGAPLVPLPFYMTCCCQSSLALFGSKSRKLKPITYLFIPWNQNSWEPSSAPVGHHIKCVDDIAFKIEMTLLCWREAVTACYNVTLTECV